MSGDFLGSSGVLTELLSLVATLDMNHHSIPVSTVTIIIQNTNRIIVTVEWDRSPPLCQLSLYVLSLRWSSLLKSISADQDATCC